MGSNFTVHTEDEKMAAKMAKKERKKHGGRDEGTSEFLLKSFLKKNRRLTRCLVDLLRSVIF